MQLTGLLEKLKMEHLGYQLDALCEQAAKKDLGYREFLLDALQTEWSGRHLKGVEARLKLARFPWVKTIEQFDFGFQPSIDRKVIRELSGLGFVDRCENVILLGPPGVGKTHLAMSLGLKFLVKKTRAAPAAVTPHVKCKSVAMSACVIGLYC